MKIGIQVPLDCAYCGTQLESFEYLYFECLISRALWSRLWHWIGPNRNIQDWNTELKWVCMTARKKTGRAEIITSCFAMLIYSIRREMNKIRFQKGRIDADRVLKDIALQLHIRSQTRQKWQEELQQFDGTP